MANFELSGKLGLDMSLVGTPAWTAPEMLRGEKEYTEKIDVYSFSMRTLHDVRDPMRLMPLLFV